MSKLYAVFDFSDEVDVTVHVSSHALYPSAIVSGSVPVVTLWRNILVVEAMVVASIPKPTRIYSAWSYR